MATCSGCFKTPARRPAGAGAVQSQLRWRLPQLQRRGVVHTDLAMMAGHDGGRIVFGGTPAELVAARPTVTGEHLAAYTGT